MGAYNKLYLEDITELQQMLFEEITDYKYELDYNNFVEKYMNCRYRKLLDTGGTRVANMSWDEYLQYLEINCPELFIKGTTDVDKLMSGWIGRIYNLLQYRLNIPSIEVYNKIPISTMKIVFRPLHTVSEEVALEKLLERFSN